MKQGEEAEKERKRKVKKYMEKKVRVKETTDCC